MEVRDKRCSNCKHFFTGFDEEPCIDCYDRPGFIRWEPDEEEKRPELLKEQGALTMDSEAIIIIENYIMEHLDKSDPEPEFEVYIVWKCKALQNWKYLLSSSLFDGMYYELTYNGDKKEWYLDAYKKFENRRIPALEA